MPSEPNEPSARFRQAVAEARGATLPDEVLARGERAILARVPARRPLLPRALVLATGLGAAAIAAALFLLPSRSMAAELRRIGKNGDAVFHRIRSYEVKPDGSLGQGYECIVWNDRWRYSFPDGEIAVVNKRVTVVHKDGSATIETQPLKPMTPPSASAVIEQNTKGHDANIAYDKRISWNGQTVDCYTVDEDTLDGRNQPMHIHFALYSDPKTDRPIEMDSKTGSFPDMVERWDYPAPDPKLLELPAGMKIRLYDLDKARASITTALGMPGKKAVVDGQTVEFLQLWVGEQGDACAIARADYPVPDNYGIQIADLKLSTLDEADQPSTHWVTNYPTMAAGRSVQLFAAARSGDSGPVNYPDRVNLSIPVFKDKKFVGYAKFDDVPVHRAWSVWPLLRPDNLPFWAPKLANPPTATATVPE